MANTYHDQKMNHALETIDKKGNIVLQKKGDDALLFMPGAVAEFCIAHGYDENTASWSHGSYFSDLTAASMEFSPVQARSDERTEAIGRVTELMDKISVSHCASNANANTVLLDLMEYAGCWQLYPADDLFDIYLEASESGRKVFESMFESIVGESFDTFLSDAEKACENTLESSEVGESLDNLMEQKIEVAADSELVEELSVSSEER